MTSTSEFVGALDTRPAGLEPVRPVAAPRVTIPETAPDLAWPRRYARLLAGLDAAAIVVALIAAYLLRFSIVPRVAEHVWIYLIISTLLAVAWWVSLTLEKSRDRRIVGIGAVEYGACVPGGDPVGRANVAGVPILGDVLDVQQAVRRTGATSVAVVGSEQITASVVRDLGYELEANGTDLIVAPALIDVAGPRVVMSPVEGLALVHVDAPMFSGVRYVVKSVIDWALALIAVVILTIPMLVIGMAIKATSSGPMLFRQERVGRNGQNFKMLKFRSMRVGAEAELAGLMNQNEGSGPLFKLRNDPRVTRVGAVLRKFSLDELPQFINVLCGHMSLVGPRPPLASEVAEYDGHAARRMLVKPGVTGLWQVSGRSDLSWEVGVRKDVYYVENWTVFGDLLILARTARTVLFPNGAY